MTPGHHGINPSTPINEHTLMARDTVVSWRTSITVESAEVTSMATATDYGKCLGMATVSIFSNGMKASLHNRHKETHSTSGQILTLYNAFSMIPSTRPPIATKRSDG